MSALADYNRFVADRPIFYQGWWLDAACGPGNWGVATVRNTNDELIGCWPHYANTQAGGLISTLDKPAFTPFFGPLLLSAGDPNKPAKLLSRQYRLLEELVTQLPLVDRAVASIGYQANYNIRDLVSPANNPPIGVGGAYATTESLLALQKRGWEIQQQYSYRLRSDTYSVAQLWQRLAGKVRTDLRKAESNTGTIKPIEDPELFLRINRKGLAHRQERTAFPEEVFRRLFLVSLAQNAACCWGYFDKENRAHAAVWLPYDRSSAYLLGAASVPGLREASQAMTNLIWHAVKWCVERQLVFDFEGSYLPGVEEYYRSFGPEVAKYATLSLHRGWKGKLLRLY